MRTLLLLLLRLGTTSTLLLLALARSASARPPSEQEVLPSNGGGARPSPGEALTCLEVTAPVWTPAGLVDGRDGLGGGGDRDGASSCVVRLVPEHVFGNSYGRPHVGAYVPPPCASSADRVVLNLSVASAGRQFDRLATLWLGDTEIWRTSTAEPRPGPGIAWTAWLDATSYLALWREPQTLILDLGNLVNERYTASFNATLTGTFFRWPGGEGTSEAAGRPGTPLAAPADRILAISAGKGSLAQAPSAWVYPDEEAASRVTLPRHASRAVVSLAATGQADEEFWWSNVPDEAEHVFNGTTLPANGAFREVRLRIDGALAGLAWPFPVVFTGGVAPPLNRPLVGPQAFHLREQEMDITPWLGVLCDGDPHEFRIEVVGADEDRPVDRYWLLSGKIFVWLGADPRHITTGPTPHVAASEPDYESGDASLGGAYARYDQTVDRTLVVSAHGIHVAPGTVLDAAWRQTFAMRNTGVVLDGGDFQNVTASYAGRDVATRDGHPVFEARYSYPVVLSARQRTGRAAADGAHGDGLVLEANLTQGVDLTLVGETVFPHGVEAFLPLLGGEHVRGGRVTTSKTGTAFFWQEAAGNRSGGFGSSRVCSSLGALGPGHRHGDEPAASRPLYWRDVSVVNETTVRDARWVYGVGSAAGVRLATESVGGTAAGDRPDTFAGRFLAGKPGGGGRLGFGSKQASNKAGGGQG